jgi:transcription elongation factor Elf1
VSYFQTIKKECSPFRDDISQFFLRGSKGFYRCKQCGLVIKGSRHKNNRHSSAYRHVCDICNSKFKAKWNLKQHMRRHFPDLQFKCLECSKVFMQKHSLDNHYRVSHRRVKLACPLCDTSYSRNFNLRNHILLRHPTDEQLAKMVQLRSDNRDALVLTSEERRLRRYAADAILLNIDRVHSLFLPTTGSPALSGASISVGQCYLPAD